MKDRLCEWLTGHLIFTDNGSRFMFDNWLINGRIASSGTIGLSGPYTKRRCPVRPKDDRRNVDN